MHPCRLWSPVAALSLLFCLGATPPAVAAAPSAWQAHDRAVGDACLAASTLQRTRIAGRPVAFDDSVGYTALLLSGRHPRPKKKHLSGRELCLYDRKTGTAHIADAETFGSARQ